MQPFRIDSSGWPGQFFSASSAHYARHTLSRRAFIGGAATATGITVGSGLLWPAIGSATAHRNRAPKPTVAKLKVGGKTFHVSSFGPGMDPSSITDFKGLVGVADVRGKGIAKNPDGSTETLLFDTDMRFMKGVYVAEDGNKYRGTFGFV